MPLQPYYINLFTALFITLQILMQYSLKDFIRALDSAGICCLSLLLIPDCCGSISGNSILQGISCPSEVDDFYPVFPVSSTMLDHKVQTFQSLKMHLSFHLNFMCNLRKIKKDH